MGDVKIIPKDNILQILVDEAMGAPDSVVRRAQRREQISEKFSDRFFAFKPLCAPSLTMSYCFSRCFREINQLDSVPRRTP